MSTINTSPQSIYLLRNIDRLAHMFFEPFYALSPGMNDPSKILVLYPEDRKPANQAAMRIISRYIRIQPSPHVEDYIRLSAELFDEHQRKVNRYSWHPAIIYLYQKRLRDGELTPRFFSFIPEEVEESNQFMRQIGVPLDAPFVCVHCREDSFRPDLEHHAFRNVSLDSLEPTIDYLIGNGYYVIRIGERQYRLRPRQGYVDLPFEHPDRNDLADIWVTTKASFMIGQSSGPIVIPPCFGGPPRVVVNHAGTTPPEPGHVLDRYIFKRVFSVKQHRLLTFKEMLFPGVLSDIQEEYDRRLLRVESNSAEDILETVKEFLNDFRAGTPVDQSSDLQRKYRAILEEYNRLKLVTGFGEAYWLACCPIATSFLKKYPELVSS